MSMATPRYELAEHARLGRQVYEEKVRAKVEGSHHGRVVALDVDTGEFEVADDTLTACDLLEARLPDAQIWCERVGFPALWRMRMRDALGSGA